MSYSDPPADALGMPVSLLMIRMAEMQEQLARDLDGIEARIDGRTDSGYASVCVTELQTLDSVRQYMENMSRVLLLLASRNSESKMVPVAEVRSAISLHRLAHRLLTGTDEETPEQFNDSGLHLF